MLRVGSRAVIYRSMDRQLHHAVGTVTEISYAGNNKWNITLEFDKETAARIKVVRVVLDSESVGPYQ